MEQKYKKYIIIAAIIALVICILSVKSCISTNSEAKGYYNKAVEAVNSGDYISADELLDKALTVKKDMPKAMELQSEIAHDVSIAYAKRDIESDLKWVDSYKVDKDYINAYNHAKYAYDTANQNDLNDYKKTAEQLMNELQPLKEKQEEEKAQKEAEEKAQREAEEKARQEAEAKAKAEAEAKAQQEAEAKARQEAEQKAKQEASSNTSSSTSSEGLSNTYNGNGFSIRYFGDMRLQENWNNRGGVKFTDSKTSAYLSIMEIDASMLDLSKSTLEQVFHERIEAFSTNTKENGIKEITYTTQVTTGPDTGKYTFNVLQGNGNKAFMLMYTSDNKDQETNIRFFAMIATFAIK